MTNKHDPAPSFVDLYEQQVENQRRVYVGDPAEFDAARAIEYVHWNTLAAMDELMELLATWSWKPWSKNYQREKADPKKVAGEIVDTFCFLSNIARAAGLSGSDLMLAWEEKIRRNRERQERGYDVSSDVWKCRVCGEELDRPEAKCSPSGMYDNLWFCAVQNVYVEITNREVG